MEKVKSSDEKNSFFEYPTTINEGKQYKYNFWKNKPVQNFDEISHYSQNIEDDLKNRKVYASEEPIKLPATMKWMEIDLNNDQQMEVIAEFLRKHYLIDTTGKFKLEYTKEFLKWALGNNGILIAIVFEKNNALCGCVGASFQHLTVFETKNKLFGNVNFLCSHPVYRGKKIAFTLIDEIARRIVQKDIQQACFTTERCIPSPVTTLRFYHRPLNYVKLNKFGFTDLELDKTPDNKDPVKMQKTIEVDKKIPDNYIPMQEEHIFVVHKLYNSFVSRYNIHVNYTMDELKNLLLNNNIVKSYVVLNKNKEVVDFVSYYRLNYFMNGENEKINASYLFLYSCENEIGSKLIENILKISYCNDMDIFNVVDTGMISDIIFSESELDNDSEDESFTKTYNLLFLKGSGKLHLNMFNWKCERVKSKYVFYTPL